MSNYNYIENNIRQIVNNLSDSKFVKLPQDMISLVDGEIGKTLNTFKGTSSFEEEVNAPENTMQMYKIDKVLRDLLFFNNDLYDKIITKGGLVSSEVQSEKSI